MTADTSVPSTALLTGADRDGSNYTARHLLVLEGLEAVRKRPGMYIGSTDSRGLMHCLWEIIDNSVDEALGGYCDHIEVILHDDASVEVRDNGRGIPVDVEPKTGLSGVEVVMTKLHAGGKFGGGSYAASGGLHGVGASVVNALSARLDVEVDRSGSTHAISFRRGVPGAFAGNGPDAKFETGGLRKGKRIPKTRTGTRVRYWADRQIFLKDAKLSLEHLHQRARQTAFLVPGLTIVVRDEFGLGEGGSKGEESFRFDGGISEFCEYLASDKPVCDVLRFSGQGTFRETVPVLDEHGQMTPTQVTRELGVDVAMRWGTGYDTTLKSFVNIIATPKGGTHVAGFEQAVATTMNEVLRAKKMLRVAEDDIVKDDALEGLTAVVTVRLAEPQFEGQTKEVLGTSAARRIVTQVVAKELKAFLTSTKRDAAAQARVVMEKAVAAARTRIAARQHKDAQRRKTALESSSLPAKLADCRSDDVERSELFIVEGDSALGTAKLARNSEFQALLPIRGKILNVQKSSVTDMLKNVECGAIIQVIGAGSGRTFDIDAARYGKIIMMTDADVDGSHIRCLLLTLFQRYMRPMVEAGRVFAAVPPLHRIELVQPKKGQDKYVYTYSDRELRDKLLEFQSKNIRYKDSIQRYKGLGEMDADQLAETTMDPRHRTLRRINLSDLEAAEQVFDLLMGNDVAPRKEFISSSAATLDRSRIDA
ncbi:DNA gyrase/topoisomerase IV subunit B [Streptomyces caniscabiei]|uniref:DNA topoisomerase (ATP-hydrolyzing) n=1 Tax=Streptomyces caniscabiei TaxID=2746961 RepID=A0A927QJ64_9ACTN|nr:DNA topoisomerase IV subunit B [Streptomyces caniscabiei]MBD9728186.1 type IIA DNA topoisomerase subunit B [Streptomyces caniscabiei]MDX3513793.1 DNA topoisomerase IV subunit B [Streptomyces caniscabiei]MDX3722795.1 DNA topoisomerase IV subunit B [Streptomyces caniscabiei]MDX3731573.1 DNA topoisomerase IV subunit B [Streptomyces caniscabiei]WEO23675.1 DNA topoisomerase IV subunit B [Streptomyces caniscabiei]